MSTTKSFGYTNTAAGTANGSTIKLDIAASYAVKSQSSSEVILTNLTSPDDQPETVKIAVQEIKDIYANTGIDPNYYAQSKKGRSIVVSFQDDYRITDSELGITDCPIQAHVVLKVPQNQNVSVEQVTNVIDRLYSFLYNINAAGTALSDDYISRLLKSAVKPADVN